MADAGGSGARDRDPLGLRAQAVIFLVAVPVVLVILAVTGGPWYSYLFILAAAVSIWAVTFRFAPWWFDWVRGRQRD